MYIENSPLVSQIPQANQSDATQIQAPPQTPPTINPYAPQGDVGNAPLPPNFYQPQSVIQKKEKREYSVKENIFAWASYILAYLFTLSVPINSKPFGLFVVIILMYAVSTVVLLIKGKKPQFMPLLIGASAVVVSTSLILTSNDFLHIFAFLYAMVAYCYYLYGLSSDHRFRFSDSIIADFIKVIFVLPFYSFSDMFVSMFSGKSNKGGRFALKVFLGIVIAIIPTLIIFALLSYDEGFSSIIENIFEDFNLFTTIVRLFLALPLGAYAYSIYISSVDKKCDDILAPDSYEKTMRTMRFAPAVTVLTAVLPILLMYVVFFISQWKYYVSGFTGVLPKGFSYAEYAREGFFQLCTVSVINLIILIFFSMFLKRKENKPSILLKIISLIFSVFTLVLISTALAKMVMYINCYGLTPKRVYSSWLMVVLALVFVLIILKQFIKKLRLVALSLAVLVVMFSALCVFGVDTFIAQYNVDRYFDGTLITVDVDLLEELGDCAVPSMVSVYDELSALPYDKMSDLEKDLFYELRDSLRNKGIELSDRYKSEINDIWSYTVPALKAQKALEETTF